MELVDVEMSFIGHHGTNADNISSIVDVNFIESDGREHWFGKGAYFFINGVNSQDTITLAQKWAIDQSWDNQNLKYTYIKYAVIEAEIVVNSKNLLDLTTTEGLQLFNQFREMVLNNILAAKKKLKRDDLRDYDVFQMIKNNLPVEVVKGNVYIKFAESRKARILSNVPNCTILCADNCKRNVNKDSIKEVFKGDIL